MEKEFDFEEAARRCDKNIFMVYYDEALTNRNFIIKLRKILELKEMDQNLLITEIISLNEELKIQQEENLKKHFTILSIPEDIQS